MRSPLALLLGSAVVFATACGIVGGGQLRGEGPVVADSRMLTAIDEIELNGSMTVDVVRADQQEITVEAQANLQPIVTTVVKGSTLVIDSDKSFTTNEEIRVEVAIPALESFKLDGSGDVAITGFNGGKLKIEINGSGDVDLADVRYDKLEIDVDGSGDVTVRGSGDDLAVDVKGSGNIDASAYPAEDVEVSTKGSGDVRVVAGSKLKVSIAGSGDVSYTGDPEVQLEDDGSGELRGSN